MKCSVFAMELVEASTGVMFGNILIEWWFVIASNQLFKVVIIVFYSFTESVVQCAGSDGESSDATCEINPLENEYCLIHCDYDHAKNTATCASQCLLINDPIPCVNITNSLIEYQLCCKTPFCNNLTYIPVPQINITPIPTPSK